jgi:hypothetical protein
MGVRRFCAVFLFRTLFPPPGTLFPSKATLLRTFSQIMSTTSSALLSLERALGFWLRFSWFSFLLFFPKDFNIYLSVF